jgi:hypothetical protein
MLVTLSVRHFSETSLKQTITEGAIGRRSQELQEFRSYRIEKRLGHLNQECKEGGVADSSIL